MKQNQRTGVFPPHSSHYSLLPQPVRVLPSDLGRRPPTPLDPRHSVHSSLLITDAGPKRGFFHRDGAEAERNAHHPRAVSPTHSFQLVLSLFAGSSEFRLCFSLINGATQVPHSGLHPAPPSLRAMSWRQQRLCCILTALVPPWVKTDEMRLVYNLDARLSAFRRFLFFFF